MGYSVYTDRQFIRVADLGFIVMIKSGSSNWRDSDDKISMSWGMHLLCEQKVIHTEQDIRQSLQEDLQDRIVYYKTKHEFKGLTEPLIDFEARKQFASYYGTRYMGKAGYTYEQVLRYYLNGIKNAKTIEELRLDGVSVKIEVNDGVVPDGVSQTVYVRTTDDLLSQLTAYKLILGGLNNVWIAFTTDYAVDQMFEKEKRNKRFKERKSQSVFKEYPNCFVLVSKKDNSYFVRGYKNGFYTSHLFERAKIYTSEQAANKDIDRLNLSEYFDARFMERKVSVKTYRATSKPKNQVDEVVNKSVSEVNSQLILF